MMRWNVLSNLALTRIGVPFPLEVPNGMAFLCELVRDSAHGADDDFLASEESSEAQTGLACIHP